MATGTIKRVIADRGFGFISAEDEKEYFFHRGALDASMEFERLVGGEKVEFDIESSPKGPRAANVRPRRLTAIASRRPDGTPHLPLRTRVG